MINDVKIRESLMVRNIIYSIKIIIVSSYRFEEKLVSGKMYVYQVADIPNDPEIGKFWLHYISSTKTTSLLMPFSTSKLKTKYNIL